MTQFDSRNLSMMMDLYEMTMANGYFLAGKAQSQATFDVFYRRNPDGGGFAVFAGLEQVLDYLEGLHFSREDVAYLRSLGQFDGAFLDSLLDYRFRGSVSAVPEGTVVYTMKTVQGEDAAALAALETAVRYMQQDANYYN